MNEQVVNLIVNTVFVFLYSFFKPYSWSRKTRERVSLVIGAALGVILAISAWDKNPMTVLELVAVAVAYSQALYRGFLEKLGIEGAIRRLRLQLAPPGPPTR